MTKEERHLWYDCLKQLPATVHRQKVLGTYIVDFYIASRKIVIEVDGSQHYEEENKQRDILRDACCTPHQSAALTASPRGEALCDSNVE